MIFNNIQLKHCPSCKTTKPVVEYHRNKARSDGLASVCKPCKSIYSQRHWAKTTPETKAQRRKYKDTQRQKRATNTEHASRHRQQLRRYHLKKNYGLTVDEYDQMVQQQGGNCAICRKPDPNKLHVDHCHRTKKNRALLCALCNAGLGCFAEDFHRLLQAARYLRKHAS